MSAYVAGTAKAIYPGDVVTLSNASILTPFRSTAVAVGPNPDGSPVRLSIVNGSGQTATVQVATTDLAASYQPLVNSDTGEAVTVATDTTGSFTCPQGFMSVVFGGDPSTGVVTVSR